jgi:hypothetical protein
MNATRMVIALCIISMAFVGYIIFRPVPVEVIHIPIPATPTSHPAVTLHYNPADEQWTTRIEALDTFALEASPADVTPQILVDLETIAAKDDDNWVAKRAAEMVACFKRDGNFQNTLPFREKTAKEQRRNMQLHSTSRPSK